MAKSNENKGVSLAKGPVLIVGLALLAFGILALLVGSATGFTAKPIDGMVSGEKFLGLEVNGWSSLLFIGAGALLMFGSPLHWGAKGLSIVVGLALGAASVIALVDKDDVFGIFAANGLTALVWGVAAAVLLVVALLPRVGGGGNGGDGDREERGFSPRRVVERESTEREPAARGRVSTTTDRELNGERNRGNVVAPADGSTPESRQTTRRQRS
jgi:hypothetical protein